MTHCTAGITLLLPIQKTRNDIRLFVYCFITATIQIYNDLAEKQYEMHLTQSKNNTIIRYETDVTRRNKDVSYFFI